MTREEQIRQNAKEYAKKHYDTPFEDDSSMNVIVSEESYIAGAHSRDEEIKELRKHDALENKMRVDLINECEQLKQELDQLRNQWISVEDRLPDKAIGKSERSKYVLCRHKNGNYYVAYWHVGLEYWYSIPYRIDKSNITHWMPISEQPK